MRLNQPLTEPILQRQTLMRKLAREAQADEREHWIAYEKEAMDKARAAGIQFVDGIDKKPFQDAVKPIWDKYGPRFTDLIKRIQTVA